MLAFILSLTAAVLLLAMPAGAQDAPAAPRRVALIMGNDTYRSLNPLSNPGLDAGRLAALLDANGFEVIRCDGKHLGCFDLTRAGMLDALETMQEKARGADLALVLYAGHGMEGRDGNVLAPIDMEVIDCTTRALRRGVPLEELFKAAAGARQRIVVLDASRENPLAQCAPQDPPQRGHSPVSLGPLPVPEAESLLLVSSTQPRQVASDGLPGTHSPFARALLQWLERAPETHLHQVLRLHVARAVIESTSRDGLTQVPETLVRGAAPEACLKATDCVGDMRAAVLEQELEALKQKHKRDQELAAIAQGYLAQAGKGRTPPPSEAEPKLDLRRLKDVRDFILEAEKGRGRPFSSEERAQELQRVMEAGRALIALDDARAGQALERLEAGDESAAKRLLAEFAETRKQAASTAEARAAEENREAAKALRHLAAIAEPRNSAEATDHYKEATRLDPADAETWIGYGRAAFFAGRRDEAKAAYERAAEVARESGNVRAQYAAARALGGPASGPEREQHYRRALALADVAARANPGSLASQSWLSESYRAIGGVLLEQGKLPDALESFGASLAIAERLAMADPADIQRQRDLAAVHNLLGEAFESRDVSQGKLGDALTSYRTALTILERLAKSDPGDPYAQLLVWGALFNVGNVLHQQRGLAEALTTHRAAFAIAQRLAEAGPSHTGRELMLWVAHRQLADSLQENGKSAAALALREAALAIAERQSRAHPGDAGWRGLLADAHEQFADSLKEQGERPESLTHYREALSIHEGLLASAPGDIARHASVAAAHGSIAGVLEGEGDPDAALASYRAAVAAYGRPAADNAPGPDRIGWRAGLLAAHGRIGAILEMRGDLAGALASYQALVGLAERQIKIEPGRAVWQESLESTHRQIGRVLRTQGSLAAALASYRAALAANEALTKADTGDSKRWRTLAEVHDAIGGILQDQTRPDAALTSYQVALSILDGLSVADPASSDLHETIALLHERIGKLLEAQGAHADALASYRAAVARFEKADPSKVSVQAGLSAAYGVVGGLLQEREDLAGALASYRALQGVVVRLTQVDPGNIYWHQALLATHRDIAGILHRQGDLSGALARYRAMRGVAEHLAGAEPQSILWPQTLAATHAVIGDILDRQNKPAEALSSYLAALTLAQRAGTPTPGNPDWETSQANWHGKSAAARYATGDHPGGLAGWRATVGMFEAQVAAIEQAETGTAGKAGAKTAELLGGVAWHALLARDFRKALAAAERARALAPDLLWLEINRAHALLFLKRTREARALYTAHKGKRVRSVLGLSLANHPWEQAVADDFRALRRAGLSHPAMGRVEAALGAAAGSPAAGKRPGEPGSLRRAGH